MMNSTSTQFVPSRRMGIYEPIHQMGMWGDFKGNNCLDASPPMILEVAPKLDNQSEDTSHGTVGPSNKYEQEASKPPDKVFRRLAQNREAARKSRLRKKAYVQQLESSKLRLIQLEQDLGRAQQQGLYAGSALDASPLGYAGSMNAVIATFELEYGHWVKEQDRYLSDLRDALNSSETGDSELRIFVDGGLRHYFELFTMKAIAAKTDAFYLMSGMWKTSAERFFFWIGGFRPSELLKVLLPHLEPLSEQQRLDLGNLAQSCQQAEDALSQGMEQLRRILAEAIAKQLGEGNYLPQVGAAIEKLDDLVRFVGQADHLRQETLQQILRILTTRQAARGFLALGEYFQRLRSLSSLWSSLPRDSS
ncbi:guanine nucleotide-binding protein, alpha-1 subunit tga1 [Salvia divinorum]|uniref:Guanine nucleotide-binding protein, alpha-1 subunit tga1 n=1 Tax=Salvia divinorum TaxID=28513 RepID=A0ABD1GAR4_SALDI